MKKVFWKSLAIAAVAVSMTACGGKKDAQEGGENAEGTENTDGTNGDENNVGSNDDATLENQGDLNGEMNAEKGSMGEGEDKTSSTPEKKADPNVLDVANITLPSALKGKVEVVSAKKRIASIGDSKYPYLDVTFKLLEKVDPKPFFYGASSQVFLAGTPQDAQGAKISEIIPTYKVWKASDRNGDIFKGFLEGDVNDTVTMEFSGNELTKDNSSKFDDMQKFALEFMKI